MERPEFNEIKDYDEFCKYYWYRKELIKICKEHCYAEMFGLENDDSSLQQKRR